MGVRAAGVGSGSYMTTKVGATVATIGWYVCAYPDARMN
jgi:hypothetical protein